jgi:hypothetical protein
MNFHDDTAPKNEPENHLFYPFKKCKEKPVIYNCNTGKKVKTFSLFFLACFVRIFKKALT